MASAGTAVLLFVRDLAGAATSTLPGRSASAALASSAGCATLTPEETQGPFWVDERLNRIDIRADSETGALQAGIPLTLTIKLQDAGASCAPQVGAYVDIWHANAQGAYSDVSGSGNWYFDGEEYGAVTRDQVDEKGDWAFDRPFYLILNLAIGGVLGGVVPETLPFPQELVVDWVRVYQ